MVHSNLRSKYTETLKMAKWHSSGLFSFIERLVKVLQAPEERGRSELPHYGLQFFRTKFVAYKCYSMVGCLLREIAHLGLTLCYFSVPCSNLYVRPKQLEMKAYLKHTANVTSGIQRILPPHCQKNKYNRAVEVNFTSRSYQGANRRTRGRSTTPPYTHSLCYRLSPCLC